MKRLKIAAFVLLLAMAQMYAFIQFPKEVPVSIISDGVTVRLAEEDAAEVISVMNRYPFWMPGGGYWCDCASDFGFVIGEEAFGISGHCHHPSKWLTLYLPEWESAKLYRVAERYRMP